MTRFAPIAALIVGLAGPAAAQPVPRPQTFVVISRARVTPPNAIGPEARALLERAEAAIVTATRLYEVDVDAYIRAADNDQGATPVEPRPDYSAARALLDEALRTLGPKDGGRDAALYLVGWLATEDGRDDGAIKAFSELAKRYPRSTYAPEAAYRLGDLHFDRGELKPARDAYARLIKSGGGPFYALGLYKLAWTDYRAARLDDAWRGFERLVGEADAHAGDARARELRPEAIEILALLLTEPDLDGDGHEDADAGWPRVAKRLDGARAHHAEVAERAVSALQDRREPELAKRVAALAVELRARRSAEPQR